MSTDSSGDDAPKSRSFADAAALLPSLVPFPSLNSPAPPIPDLDIAAAAGPAAASRPSVTSVTFGTLTPPASQPALIFNRRTWGFVLAPIVAAALAAAWYGGRQEPVRAALPTAESATTAQAPGPVAAGPAAAGPAEVGPGSDAGPKPERDAGDRQLRTSSVTSEAAAPGAAASSEPGVTPVAYDMIVLHPRPASAKSDAANARIIALLQPLTARLETQKTADTQGRLTVHYFHAEDAAAAQTLADTVRAPGARVKVVGPVRTQKARPSGSFEVWLRGPY